MALSRWLVKRTVDVHCNAFEPLQWQFNRTIRSYCLACDLISEQLNAIWARVYGVESFKMSTFHRGCCSKLWGRSVEFISFQLILNYELMVNGVCPQSSPSRRCVPMWNSREIFKHKTSRESKPCHPTSSQPKQSHYSFGRIYLQFQLKIEILISNRLTFIVPNRIEMAKWRHEKRKSIIILRKMLVSWNAAFKNTAQHASNRAYKSR